MGHFWKENMQLRNVGISSDSSDLEGVVVVVTASKYSTLEGQVQMALCTMAAVIFCK